MSKEDKSLDDLIVEQTGYVAHVRLNRPPHNFTDITLMKNLADQLSAFESNVEKVRSIIISSNGKSFSAGANFSQGGVGGSGDFEKDTKEFYQHAARIISCRLPIVCAIQGAAVGAGLGLAMAGDFRICSERAYFWAPFVRLGIHPGFALTLLLPSLLGLNAAFEILLKGEKINSTKAKELGIVTEVVSEEQLLEKAYEVAELLSSHAPLAIIETKATLKRKIIQELDSMLAHELSKQAELFATKDAMIGISASINKQVPKFTAS